MVLWMTSTAREATLTCTTSSGPIPAVISRDRALSAAASSTS